MTALTPEQRHRAGVFERDPHECAMSPKYTGWPRDDSRAGPCDGRLHADHILKWRLILTRQAEVRLQMQGRKRYLFAPETIELAEASPDDLIADARNGWILCERHHGLKDRKLVVLIAEVILPDPYFGFVTAYDLTALHDREFQRPARAERSAPCLTRRSD